MNSILAISLSLSTAMANPSCPARIDTQQQATVPNGWDVIPPALSWSRLVGAGFSTGHPSRLVFAIPEVKEFKNRTEATFTIGQTNETVWIVCTYDGTKVNIAKAIGSPSKCVVSTTLVDQSISIKCAP
jgi:hypothetical protein